MTGTPTSGNLGHSPSYGVGVVNDGNDERPGPPNCFSSEASGTN